MINAHIITGKDVYIGPNYFNYQKNNQDRQKGHMAWYGGVLVDAVEVPQDTVNMK